MRQERAELAKAVERVLLDCADLPPGCEVTYDLQVVDVLRRLLSARSDSTADIDLYYGDFKERTGCRPLAAEAFHEGYNPRMVRKSAGSWVAFVDSKCDLNTKQKLLRLHHHAFLNILEITPMTRSFKMLTLLAMLNRDSLPGSIEIGDLAREFSRLAGRSAALRADVGVSLDDHGQLRKYLERNPVAAWAGRKRNGRNCLLYLRTRNFSFHL